MQSLKAENINWEEPLPAWVGESIALTRGRQQSTVHTNPSKRKKIIFYLVDSQMSQLKANNILIKIPTRFFIELERAICKFI
jgi:hypothetical protein